MNAKKYELTSESITYFGRKLFRIKALISFDKAKAGEFGGYIEKEENLSQNGNAWVYGDAMVFDNARVFGNAWVFDNARVFGNAEVSGDAWVSDNAEVFGNAWVSGDAEVFGNAWVFDNARVFGNAEVSGDAWVSDNARVSGNADYMCIKGTGSAFRNTTFFKTKNGDVSVKCGCFSGNLIEFEKKVKETHGNSKFAKEYLAAIELVKIHFEIEEEA